MTKRFTTKCSFKMNLECLIQDADSTASPAEPLSRGAKMRVNLGFNERFPIFALQDLRASSTRSDASLGTFGQMVVGITHGVQGEGFAGAIVAGF